MSVRGVSQTLKWASQLQVKQAAVLDVITPGSLKRHHYTDLVEYFRLCAISRAKRTPPDVRREADDALFRTRTVLEHSLIKSLPAWPHVNASTVSRLASRFFGVSKKQGVSVRMPLTTCMPSALCGSGCYAHDVLDAAAPAIVRGAINGWLAEGYESGNSTSRHIILSALSSPIVGAVRAAVSELKQLPADFTRRPYIRFSHVGEIVAYPQFADALADAVAKASNGGVDCVVYTRHKKAIELNADRWVINFTLDPVSLDRRTWVPRNARIVFSAFGGMISEVAEINFLEHHRHTHLPILEGTGNVCPATLPDTLERTCDACKCKMCFQPPNSP